MTCEPRTYLQEPAADCLPTSSSAITPSSPSSGIHTPAPSCAASSPASASSKAMSDPWTSRESWLASMRCALDSLAPTSAQPIPTGAESTASEADSTEKSCVQSTLYDLPGFSWKTHPASEPKDGTSSSETWWRADIPGATESCPRLMLERPTSATDGGYLPTVTATSHKQGFRSMAGGSSQGRPLLAKAALTWPTPAATDHKTPYRGEALMRQKAIRSKPLRDAISAPAGGKLNPPMGRVVDGMAAGSHGNWTCRIKGLGNGHVPLAAAAAWRLLGGPQ